METSDAHPRFPAAEEIGSEPLKLVLRGDSAPLFLDGAGLQVKVRLTPERPPLEISSGADWPQLDARFVVTRPDLIAEDPRQGWRPCGGLYPTRMALGAGTGEGFPFPEVEPSEARLFLCAYETYLTLTACGNGGAVVETAAASLISASEALRRDELQTAA